MKHKILSRLSVLLFLLQLMICPQRTEAATAAMFCNGNDNTYNMGGASGLTTAQINGFKASGFTTMILFTMSVLTNGDFYYAGQTICTNGVYDGPSNWGSLLAQCKVAPSSVNRIEMCLGGAGDASWANIKNLIAANGTNSSTVLYQNLSALKNALGINAIDSDDESTYDSGSAINFGLMCSTLGMKMTLCPYTDSSYWAAVKSGLGSEVDYIYLQCYSGGAGNDPGTWASSMGVPVSQIVPGYWDYERNATFLTNMMTWAAEGCSGGSLWPSCTGCNPPANPSEMIQYAGWMLTAFSPAQTTNAYDVAANSAYTGDGPPNRLSPGGQNGGFGFGAWTFTVQNTGGAFIQTNGPGGNSFDLWNTSANSSTVAVRPFASPLSVGQSFTVSTRLNSLDTIANTNEIALEDSSGNILFGYWHYGFEANANNGWYRDATTNDGVGVNFQYAYTSFQSFTFILNSPTNYTFVDNSTGSKFTGRISNSQIARVAFFRGNGSSGTTSGGNDFQFDLMQIVSASAPTFIAQSPASGSYSASRTNVSVQVVDGSVPVNTNTIVFQVDGGTAAPTITKSGGVTTISYSPGSPLSPGVAHVALVTLADDYSISYTNTWNFTTGCQSLPATLPGPIVVSNNESGLVIFSAAGDAWLGTNYGPASSQTVYARFSMEFDNLNGKTGNGSGGGFGGLHFYEGGANGTPHLIAGNAWISTNWSADPYPPLPQTDLDPVTPIVFHQWHTIVERVDYTPGGNSTVNLWLDPNFNLTEGAQPNAPLTFSMDDTFDTVLLRTGNGTTSATFSNIVMAATSAQAGFQPASSPRIMGIGLTGTTLLISATNGTAGGSWTLLQSTNLALPLSQWQTNLTGNFDGSGNLSTNIASTVTNRQEFYILKVQ